MAIQIPEVIKTLFDNANVGKFVTDVGAGLALAAPLLMIFGLSTGITVIPLSTVAGLKERQTDQDSRHYAAEAAFCQSDDAGNTGGADTGKTGEQDLPPTERAAAHECYLQGVRQIARLNASVEAVRQQIAADQRANRPLAADLLGQLREQQGEADDLAVRQAIVEEHSATRAALTTQLADANSFSFNMRALGENLSALLAFSVILGVIISQLSRYIFVESIFDRILKKRSETPLVVVTSQDYQELRTNYLRYVEGAINIIPPILLFGIVFPVYARDALRLNPPVSPLAWGFGSAVVSLLLGLVAFNTYRSYTKKLEELSAGFAPQQRQPQAPLRDQAAQAQPLGGGQ